MLLEFALVQLFVQSIVQVIFLDEAVHLHLELVIELLQCKLISDFHFITKGFDADLQFHLVDHVLADRYMMFLDINLYLSEQLLHFDHVTRDLPLFFL